MVLRISTMNLNAAYQGPGRFTSAWQTCFLLDGVVYRIVAKEVRGGWKASIHHYSDYYLNRIGKKIRECGEPFARTRFEVTLLAANAIVAYSRR